MEKDSIYTEFISSEGWKALEEEIKNRIRGLSSQLIGIATDRIKYKDSNEHSFVMSVIGEKIKIYNDLLSLPQELLKKITKQAENA